MSKPSINDDLRAKLGAAEGRRIEIESELAELGFAAHVEADPKSIKRLKEISSELAQIDTELKSLTAALAENARREAAAEAVALAKRRKADAEKAGAVIAEAERLAELMDTTMRNLQKHAVDFQEAMADIRRLSGAGPQHDGVRALLSRAVKAGLMSLPQYQDVLQPDERRSVAEITAAWATQVRNRINNVIETAKAA